MYLREDMFLKLFFRPFPPESIAVLPVGKDRMFGCQSSGARPVPAHSLKGEAENITAVVLSWVFIKTGRAGWGKEPGLDMRVGSWVSWDSGYC